MRNRKKVYIIILSALFIGLLVFFNYRFFLEIYIRAFRKSVVIEYRNKAGELNGRFTMYENGKVITDAYFFNGLAEGWVEKYYKSGALKNRAFFRKNNRDGKETEYYENGNVNYTNVWVNDKRYGNGYHYLENGKLSNYSAFDREDWFLVVEYAKPIKSSKLLGTVVSPRIYAKLRDSTMQLNNNETYLGVNDIQIIAATPPELATRVSVTINNRNYVVTKISGNTIVIKDAFAERGVYTVKVVGELLDKNNIVVKSDSFAYTITKG